MGVALSAIRLESVAKLCSLSLILVMLFIKSIPSRAFSSALSRAATKNHGLMPPLDSCRSHGSALHLHGFATTTAALRCLNYCCAHQQRRSTTVSPLAASRSSTSTARSRKSSDSNSIDSVPHVATATPKGKRKRSKTQLKKDLKEYRTQQSSPLGKPPYTVFTNAALDEIYARLPTNLDELLDVKGIGPKKLEMFGDDILSIVAQYTDVNGGPRTVAATANDDDDNKIKASRPALIGADSLTNEQKRAADLLLSADRPNVFVSGSAGTGKSYVLQYIVQEMQQGRIQQPIPDTLPTISTAFNTETLGKKDDKNDDFFIVEEEGGNGIVESVNDAPGAITSLSTKIRVGVCAPTGVAAVHVGGSTLHSFFGIGLGTGSLSSLMKKVKSNNEAMKRIDETDTLIIDECSMLSSDLLETLDAVVRNLRKEGRFIEKPFGGMQVVCFGDFYQLPPIAPGRHKPFCFDSPVWSELGLSENMIELKEVQRQDHRDFVEFLNRVRVGRIDQRDVDKLNERCVISKDHPLPSDGIVPTRLYSLNKDVDAENDARLAELDGEEVVCQARNTWKENMPVGTLAGAKKKMAESLSKEMPNDVRMKVGAQVMLTRNKDLDRNLVNGSRGVVIRFDRAKDGETIVPVVRFDCGVVSAIAPVEAIRYNPDGGPGCLARLQIPLKLAWAITVHKSQGTTLTRAMLDISSAFEYGQCYVALSRVRSLEGLWLLKPAASNNIKVSPQVLDFHKER